MQVAKKAAKPQSTTPAPDGTTPAAGDQTTPSESQPAEQQTPERRYQGTVDAIRKILAEEGLNGLYAGLPTASFAQAVTQFVYYYCYSWLTGQAKKLVSRGQPVKELSVSVNLLVGAAAAAITAVSTNPVCEQI